MIRCIGQPPYGKSTSEWLSPILYYTYKYIDSLNPRGQVSIFKTLEMRSTQSLAAKFLIPNDVFRDFCLPLTLFPTAYFFRGSHGGVESTPPMENPLWSV